MVDSDIKKIKHEEHAWDPKETLKSYKTNPFDSGPDKITTNSAKVCSEIILALLQVLEQTKNVKIYKNYASEKTGNYLFTNCAAK